MISAVSRVDIVFLFFLFFFFFSITESMLKAIETNVDNLELCDFLASTKHFVSL